ncbi:hypothetical protein SKAU_G00392560 [Synaphobranchus kaupii]|uniref:Reverse transcriptase domain-containing protein n=1 Tax=Synaphobranchus kaupii TaxID=118154 RepID=A0A9Q1EBQ9_SYNKA|nr:hypothetical protein SKAU_G00392560 [Synaphobranchus kaupii]
MVDDGNFFSVSRFKVKTRVQHFITRELLYADDAALCANSLRQLQELLDGFSQACADFGLTISLKKTVTLSSEIHDSHQFTINDATLDRVNKFTYLGSTMTANATLDQEISVRLGKSASTFGRLSKKGTGCSLTVSVILSSCSPVELLQLGLVVQEKWRRERALGRPLFTSHRPPPLPIRQRFVSGRFHARTRAWTRCIFVIRIRTPLLQPPSPPTKRENILNIEH